LLRGINVGGKNRVPMGELGTLFESLGLSEVSTLIQSGNVLFSSQGPIERTGLEQAIAQQFLVNTFVVLRSPADLVSIVERNPFPHLDSSSLHVGFMTEKPPPAAVAKLDLERFAPEQCVVDGRELYLHLPNGMARTKLPAYLDRQLKTPITIRNWNTLTKLVELAG
jgi:uncharacterized protein (DUF1697 family)